MKCPICNGKGYQFVADYDGMYDIVCEQCKGKGELDENGKPILTNEEYLKSCTTEQLAEWMALRLNPGILLALRMKYHCTDINAVREWLKEKHD